ncbi:conserved hypothetical protein [Culex quinquefasciatus]|uniref:BTB domain-containing protein n=1 Tax=Culex quinquefasciatus TaxID=7176 RepID=B0W2F9_CULQU|nr:conserved hypothetical protein [Culex quinquefasciatus]|eukprot:XP_001842862.1 conserved hypothetical protein [Culex quinquefasciatus]
MAEQPSRHHHLHLLVRANILVISVALDVLNNPASMEQTCTTTMKTTSFSHVWIVQNYSSIAPNMPLRSMEFTSVSPQSRQPVSWYYMLEFLKDFYTKKTRNQQNCQPQDNYYNSSLNNKANVLAIEAFTGSTYISRSRLHANIALQIYVGSKYSISGIFEADSEIGECIQIDRPTVQSNCVKNDTLTLTFHCTLYEEILKGDPRQQAQAQQIPDSLLVSHLDELFTKNKFSDVTMIIGKKQFRAHKAILAVRSPVFAAMFEHDMQESKENTEVLRFIYTGKVQDMDQLARALLIAADKYSLDTLKSKCSEHLGSRLSVATATATLELADKYNAGALKQQAIKFISKHVKQLNPGRLEGGSDQQL